MVIQILFLKLMTASNLKFDNRQEGCDSLGSKICNQPKLQYYICLVMFFVKAKTSKKIIKKEDLLFSQIAAYMKMHCRFTQNRPNLYQTSTVNRFVPHVNKTNFTVGVYHKIYSTLQSRNSVRPCHCIPVIVECQFNTGELTCLISWT